MLRCLLGLAISVTGTLLGLMSAGGHVARLLHIAEIAIVFGFVAGGLTTAFGFSQTFRMFYDAVTPPQNRSAARLRLNVMICEGASKFALYGGFTACFLGVVITFGVLGGDVVGVGERFGAAATGLVLGAGIAGIIFQPLKFRFLILLQELEEEKHERAADPHEEVMS